MLDYGVSGEVKIETCRRCGECCRKSSPTLHLDDAPLVRKGTLRLQDLYVLRKGEFAHDTIRGGLVRLDAELIKIREESRDRRCIFFSPEASGCTMYASRPAQCRTLECWNPAPLVNLFSQPKLSRRDIVTDPQLSELILAHEDRTSYLRLGDQFARLRKDGTGEALILEILNYDLHFRSLVAERLSLDPLELPFYFGRPMIECLRGFGYAARGTAESGYSLQEVSIPTQPAHDR